MADFQLVDVNVLKTLFEVRYDTAFIQERTRECNDLWRGYCNGINWGRNTLAKAQIIDALIIPKSGIGDLSDGYHTFNELYYQRLILFAALVRQHKNRAWKSFRHEDGELCFGGGWFIVGIDTPEGSYTYHYENKDFDLFDCVELPVGKHWDGHTEKDVTRLLSLPCDEVQRWIPVTERMPELYGQHTNRICGPIDEVYLNRIRDLEHQLQLAYSEINHLRFPRPLMPRWRAAKELPVLRTEVYDLGGEQVTEETSKPVIGLCTNGDIVSVRYVRSECFSGWAETEYAGSRKVAYWMPMPELPEEFRNER